MCLLVNQSKFSPPLSDAWLSDFYSYNEDGVGVMYSENGILIIEKALPKDADSFIKFYRKHILGRDCAFHLRMKTHGSIDLENCHPYEVLNRREHGADLWLMHNGILATGNSADVTKSDTWHYIRDIIRPMLENNALFYKHPAFAEIVGTHIGKSNKFVLMDQDGFRVTINESEGVYWGGLWLSNEYAWSASASASDSPFDDPEKALNQVSEKPIKRTYYPQSYSAPVYYDGEAYSERGFFDTIDGVLDALDKGGFKKAASIPFRDCCAFAEEYGASAFGELADMVLYQEISEADFEKMILNFDYAEEFFPWLADGDTLSEDQDTLENRGWDYV